MVTPERDNKTASALHSPNASSEDVAASGLPNVSETVAAVAADMDWLVAAAQNLLDLELGLHAGVALTAHEGDGSGLEGNERVNDTAAVELYYFSLSQIWVLHSSR